MLFGALFSAYIFLRIDAAPGRGHTACSTSGRHNEYRDLDLVVRHSSARVGGR